MAVDDIFSQAETFEEPELEVSFFSMKTVADSGISPQSGGDIDIPGLV